MNEIAPWATNLASKLITEPLRRTQLFSEADEALLAAVASVAVRRVFTRREMVVREGDPGDRMFVIIEGRARVFVASPGGKEVTLATLGPTDSFGELSLIEGTPRSASVEAASETLVVFGIGRDVFFDLLQKSPSLVEALLVSMSRTIRRITEHTAEFAFFDVHQRAARYLLELCDRSHPDGDDYRFGLARVQADLINLLGRNAEAVLQVLNSFEVMGGLRIQEEDIVIRNPDVLRDQVENQSGWSALASSSMLDPLTELANRRLFNDRIVAAFSRAIRLRKPVGVIMIDLDHFKAINDTMGHPVGDMVLSTVAERLKGSIRKHETAARLGGDEFALLLEDFTDDKDLELVAARVLEEIKKPMAGGLTVGGSIGWASIVPESTSTVEDLMRRADEAMYKVKRARHASR